MLLTYACNTLVSVMEYGWREYVCALCNVHSTSVPFYCIPRARDAMPRSNAIIRCGLAAWLLPKPHCCCTFQARFTMFHKHLTTIPNRKIDRKRKCFLIQTHATHSFLKALFGNSPFSRFSLSSYSHGYEMCAEIESLLLCRE